MKRLLISHIDLDGAGGAFLGRYFNKNLQFDKIICRDYGFEEIEDEFDFLSSFDEIIFSDLSISQEKTNELRKKGIIVKFFDHHEKANWLNEDKDSVFSIEHSGTSLFWNYYVKKIISRYPPIIDEFVSLVDTYDLWKQDNPLWESAKNLNNVLFGLRDYKKSDQMESMEPFFELLDKKIKFFKSWTETEKEKEIIEKANQREKEMYDRAIKNLQIRVDKKGKIFGLFPITSKISIVCSQILKEQENLDYLVAFNTWGGLNGKLSFRSRNGFNCNDIGVANGHDSAAGGSVSADLALKILEDSELVFTYNEDFDSSDEKTFVERV